MSRLELAAGFGAAALAGFGVLPLTHRPAAPNAWFELHWPRTVDEEAALALLRHLAAIRRPEVVTFELQAIRGRLRHLVGVPDVDTGRLRHVFASFLPDVMLAEAERAEPPVRRAVEVRLTTRERALRVDEPGEIARSIVAALAATKGTAILQWQLGTRLSPLFVPDDSVGLPSTGRAVAQAAQHGLAPIDSRARKALEQKVGERGFRATLRIGTSIAEPAVAKGVIRAVLGGLRVSEAPGTHLKARGITPTSTAKAKPRRHSAMAINVGELVGLLGWPFGDATYPGVSRVGSRRLPIPTAVPSTGRVIGVGNHAQTPRPVAQPIDDACMSTWLLGPTGVGKSTVMARLIAADIAEGRGALVIDPKGGDLIDDVLALIPAKRVNDIVVLDPNDPAPVGINPLASRSSESAADSVLTILYGIFGRELGPRSTDIIYAAIAALAEQPGGTLAAVPVLLSNAGYRREVTKSISDPTARNFWQWFEQLGPAEQAAVTAPVGNKLRALTRASLRSVLSQPEPRFNVHEVFDNNKVLLVALDHATLGTAGVALLGSIVVAEAWRAIQARSRAPKANRKPTIVYLDEWQLLTHGITDIGDAMARARGYGVGWTVANQAASQLEPALRSGALTNARSKIAWRLGAEDAGLLARSTKQLDADDFQSLGRYETYCSMVVDGEAQPFFSMTTESLGEAISKPDEVRAMSRERYGIDRQITEAAYRELWEPTSDNNPIGSRKRRSAAGDSEGGS